MSSKKVKLMRSAYSLLLVFPLCLSNCSSHKSIIEGEVCVANNNIVGFSCADSARPEGWVQTMFETDGYVCYPPEVNKKILKKAYEGSQ